MRAMLILVAGMAGLGGCSPRSDPSTTLGAEEYPVCASAARERASDAALNGIETAVQREIYRQTYASCAAIQKKIRFDNTAP